MAINGDGPERVLVRAPTAPRPRRGRRSSGHRRSRSRRRSPSERRCCDSVREPSRERREDGVKEARLGEARSPDRVANLLLVVPALGVLAGDVEPVLRFALTGPRDREDRASRRGQRREQREELLVGTTDQVDEHARAEPARDIQRESFWSFWSSCSSFSLWSFCSSFSPRVHHVREDGRDGRRFLSDSFVGGSGSGGFAVATVAGASTACGASRPATLAPATGPRPDEASNGGRRGRGTGGECVPRAVEERLLDVERIEPTVACPQRIARPCQQDPGRSRREARIGTRVRVRDDRRRGRLSDGRGHGDDPIDVHHSPLRTQKRVDDDAEARAACKCDRRHRDDRARNCDFKRSSTFPLVGPAPPPPMSRSSFRAPCPPLSSAPTISSTARRHVLALNRTRARWTARTRAAHRCRARGGASRTREGRVGVKAKAVRFGR
jgi:hypothetical protein